MNVLSSGKDTDTFILTTICLCLTNQTNFMAVLLTQFRNVHLRNG
nr:MAG TPA: hypothetical protein [Caudoviricetes sp.]